MTLYKLQMSASVFYESNRYYFKYTCQVPLVGLGMLAGPVTVDDTTLVPITEWVWHGEEEQFEAYSAGVKAVSMEDYRTRVRGMVQDGWQVSFYVGEAVDLDSEEQA